MENANTRTFRNRERVLTVGQLFDRVDNGLKREYKIIAVEPLPEGGCRYKAIPTRGPICPDCGCQWGDCDCTD